MATELLATEAGGGEPVPLLDHLGVRIGHEVLLSQAELYPVGRSKALTARVREFVVGWTDATDGHWADIACHTGGADGESNALTFDRIWNQIWCALLHIPSRIRAPVGYADRGPQAGEARGAAHLAGGRPAGAGWLHPAGDRWARGDADGAGLSGGHGGEPEQGARCVLRRSLCALPYTGVAHKVPGGGKGSSLGPLRSRIPGTGCCRLWHLRTGATRGRTRSMGCSTNRSAGKLSD